jgi:VWFA-related protein
MNALRAAALVVACLPAVAWAEVGLPALPGAAGLAQTRRVFVTAVDGNGVPVTDLTAADFTIKEGGKEREIVKAGPATGPLQIAILVDDNGTGIFRYAVGKFIESLLGRAEFGISTVTGQLLRIVDYTPKAEALSEAIAKLNARPATNDGGQLLDAISETAQELQKREAARPVILALTVGGEEHSTLPAHHVLDKLRQSGAVLHVVAVANNALRSQSNPSTAAGLLGENMNLNEVLGDGPKQSGGRREEIVAATGIPGGLEQLARSLKNQYLIEYTLPDGVKPSDKLSVAVKRKGVTLRAPSRIPNK